MACAIHCGGARKDSIARGAYAYTCFLQFFRTPICIFPVDNAKSGATAGASWRAIGHVLRSSTCMRRLHRKRLGMVGRCIRLTFCMIALCFGGSAGAQQPGKILYAAQCEKCHKSPRGVTTFHGGVDLKTFLGELHHADTPESAASIANYLKELEQAAQSRADETAKKRRRTKQRGGANFPPPTQFIPTSAEPSEDGPVKRTIKRLFPWANP